jgi:bla regulator protein blaR1
VIAAAALLAYAGLLLAAAPRLAARPDPRLGALVVEHAEPAAYCLPGRHHLLVALAAVPGAAFGCVPAFRRARDEVARLAELAADDVATARSPRLAVAGALLALGSAPAAASALGAGGSTAAARVRRLIAAPDPLSRAGLPPVRVSVRCPP